MVQTTNWFFDEVARLMNDAAGVAQGVRREFETLFRNQTERFLRDLDVVKREEFEAVKDMARLAREENEALKARIAALESEACQSCASQPPGRATGPPDQRRASIYRRLSASGRHSPTEHPGGAGPCPYFLFSRACAAISAATAASPAPLEADAEFPFDYRA